MGINSWTPKDGYSLQEQWGSPSETVFWYPIFIIPKMPLCFNSFWPPVSFNNLFNEDKYVTVTNTMGCF